jgi:predicted NBD/HSP70 family sugar kinase
VPDHNAQPVEDDPRRIASRDSVIGALQRHGPLSRSDLVARTSLSRATISSIVGELQAAGLVVERQPEDAGGRGRRPALVSLDRSAGAALGIDFGKRHLRVVVADLGHEVLAERRETLPSDHTAAQGVELAVELAGAALAEAGIARDAVVGVGMGLPGPITARTGRLGSSTILPGWVGVNAEQAMSARLGMQVRVDNDANLGALAEWTWGAARGCGNVVYVKAATGIGAGLILEGLPFRGAGGTAGEIGHTIIDADGPVCRCGNRGCLETLVGVPALLELLRPALGEVTISGVIEAAHAGDAACRRVLGDAGRVIGHAVAHVCNLINPECIVVGGDLAGAGEIILAPMRDAIARAAVPSAAEDARVTAGRLGERAEVLGAVALALRQSGRGVLPGRAEVAA